MIFIYYNLEPPSTGNVCIGGTPNDFICMETMLGDGKGAIPPARAYRREMEEEMDGVMKRN